MERPSVRDAIVSRGAFGDADSIAARVAAGALTGAVGSAVFNPIDVVRIRMQGPTPYPSTLGAFGAFFFSRRSPYDRVRVVNFIPQGLSLPVDIPLRAPPLGFNALITRRGPRRLSLPAVVVSLRPSHGWFQPPPSAPFNSNRRLRTPPRRLSVASSVAIAKRDGVVRGLWRGTDACVARAALLSGSQLATYDSVKKHLKANGGFEEGPGLHFHASFTSGIVAQTVTMPADTLKVRFTRTVQTFFTHC